MASVGTPLLWAGFIAFVLATIRREQLKGYSLGDA